LPDFDLAILAIELAKLLWQLDLPDFDLAFWKLHDLSFWQIDLANLFGNLI
jgi:hypothetical protein